MNALVPAAASNAEIYRASTDAAGLCREIVLKTAMTIQARKYVKVEGWQAIAIAHGCTGSARDVEAIEGGVRAIGEVRRMSDGALIAQAEGFVGADEPTWYGGTAQGRNGPYTLPKRPDYAIRAMAQTRAISRACRSAFAHVVVLIDANLSTTPAEEVPDGGFDNGAVIEGGSAAQAPRETARPAATPPKAREAAKATTPARLTVTAAVEAGLPGKLKEQIWGCKTRAEIDAWEAAFDTHTAQAPAGWLDAIRQDVAVRREEIAGKEVAAAASPKLRTVLDTIEGCRSSIDLRAWSGSPAGGEALQGLDDAEYQLAHSAFLKRGEALRRAEADAKAAA